MTTAPTSHAVCLQLLSRVLVQLQLLPRVLVQLQLLPRVLVRFAGVLRPLQLHLQSLGSNLEPIHGLNGALSRERVVETDKPKTLAEASVLVDEDFGADDATERLEHLNEICVLYIVREMVDEEIAALRACECVCVRVCV